MVVRILSFQFHGWSTIYLACKFNNVCWVDTIFYCHLLHLGDAETNPWTCISYLLFSGQIVIAPMKQAQEYFISGETRKQSQSRQKKIKKVATPYANKWKKKHHESALKETKRKLYEQFPPSLLKLKR